MAFDNKDEKLFRAIYPPDIKPLFWTSDGRLSRAAFNDANGLSVERAEKRTDGKVVTDMKKYLRGLFFYVTVGFCHEWQIHIEEKPSKISVYHCELWRDNNTKQLSLLQQTELAKNAFPYEEPQQ